MYAVAGIGTFTIGMVWKEDGSGTDEGFWGGWNGSGMMFGYNGGMNVYGSGSLSTSQSLSGTHLWIATSDSGTLTLYKDGTSVASGSQTYTPTSTQTWGINWYSSGLHNAKGWASDCFYIPQALDSTEVAGIAAEFTAI